MPAEQTRTKVTIFTGSYRIKGYIEVMPGSRVTDFMTGAKDFIAVTDAEVWTLPIAGQPVLSSPFVDVSRNHIQVITPEG